MDKQASQYIIDVINQQMNMPKNSVWLRDQNKDIPNDDGLYIVVGFVTGVPYYNGVRMEQEGEDQHQISTMLTMENIQIDVLSRSNAALFRKEQVLMALQSFYMLQLQERYNFKIARLPKSFVNTSETEGGSRLNKYTITISALVWYIEDVVLTSPLGDYFDEFTQRVDDDKTIGTDNPIAEFEITEDTPPPPYPPLS